MKIDIIEQGIVASRPKQMYAWPGITMAQNGDIIVSASERKFHMGPYGREVIIRSTDNGYTWQLPQEVYNSELDDRDANIIALKDGTLVLSWFTSIAFAEHSTGWPERAARVTEKMRNELLGTWMLKSHDNGETWDDQPLNMPVGMHIAPTELSDASLISIGFENRFENDKDKILSCYKSDDVGETWYKTVEFDCPTKDGRPILNENNVLEISPGKLIVLFRKCNDYLYQASSEDYGKSWSKPIQIDIWGYPPHMLKLTDGRILCTVGHRKDPYSIRGFLSDDNGLTWNTDNMFTLYEWNDDDRPDMGYPVSLEVASGEILTVFYCSRDPQTPDQPSPWPLEVQKNTAGILSVRYKL